MESYMSLTAAASASSKVRLAAMIFIGAVVGGCLPKVLFRFRFSYLASDVVIPILTALAGGICFAVGMLMVGDAAVQVAVKWGVDKSILYAQTTMILTFVFMFCLETAGDIFKEKHLQYTHESYNRTISDASGSISQHVEVPMNRLQSTAHPERRGSRRRSEEIGQRRCGKKEGRDAHASQFRMGTTADVLDDNMTTVEASCVDMLAGVSTKERVYNTAMGIDSAVFEKPYLEPLLNKEQFTMEILPVAKSVEESLQSETSASGAPGGAVVTFGGLGCYDVITKAMAEHVGTQTDDYDAIRSTEESANEERPKVIRRKRKRRETDSTGAERQEREWCGTATAPRLRGAASIPAAALDRMNHSLPVQMNGHETPHYVLSWKKMKSESGANYSKARGGESLCNVNDISLPVSRIVQRMLDNDAAVSPEEVVCRACDSDIDQMCTDYDASECFHKSGMHPPRLSREFSRAVRIGMKATRWSNIDCTMRQTQTCSSKCEVGECGEGNKQDRGNATTEQAMQSDALRNRKPDNALWSDTLHSADVKVNENVESGTLESYYSGERGYVAHEPSVTRTTTDQQPNVNATRPNNTSLGSIVDVSHRGAFDFNRDSHLIHRRRSDGSVQETPLDGFTYSLERMSAAALFFLLFTTHSLLEGIGLGSSESSVLTIGFGILLHKGLAAFAVGVTFLECNVTGLWFYFFITLFALMTPLGVACGALAIAWNDRGSLTGFATAAASGAFVFIAVCELIPKAFRSKKNRAAKAVALVIGSCLACWASLMEG